ncbi:MAG: DNA polymerase III subunit [Deltaproteobacteria bacterium]|uniref:DNA polymerase III subunit delta' n=1 Tax=Candidatus Zymogenus saltonus TaxID=2844893 RepID=A0A9D8KK65_9DELT|nr:DNA polymerase III subunit [Candidatus Zymogenus saltonus]
MIDFSDIRGQGRAADVLSGLFDSKRVPHAMIFSGPEGVGKGLVAARFAAALLCKGEGAVPCGGCGPCMRIKSGVFPDLITVGIQEGRAKILIEQIREIEGILAYRPFYGEGRVVIIDPADMMSDGASAAILKTLEEPPKGTHFILVTSRAFRLPATIISRCQRVRFSPLSPEDVVGIIRREGVANGEEEASRFCRGSVSRAQSMIRGGFLGVREDLIGALSKMRLNDPKTADDLSQKVSKLKNSIPEVLDILKLWYRDVIVYNSTGSLENLVNRDLIEKWGKGWSNVDQSSLIKSVESTEEISDLYMRGTNINMRLAFLMLFIRLTELKHGYRKSGR